MIDCIETDQFTLGILGRSGTRSYANYITRFYSDYFWEAMRNVHLGIISVEDIEHEFSHHYYSTVGIEEFNQIDNKIMVIRDPIERAKSGIRVMYEPTFHGSPILQYIDWDKIDYVIDFNETDLYLGGSGVARKLPIEDEISLGKQAFKLGGYEYESRIQKWSLDDFDYTEEIITYERVMNDKPRLPLDLWIEYLKNVTCCNIPSKKLKFF